MSQLSEEFARMAAAEQWLCAEAGPLLDTIVRSIESRAGIAIGELRVTFDRNAGHNGFSVANCTIVRADVVSSNSNGAGSTPHHVTEAIHSPIPSAESGAE
jgi:hypothetical protein